MKPDDLRRRRPPTDVDYWLRDAAVPSCLIVDRGAELGARVDREEIFRVDIRIDGGVIGAIVPAGAAPSHEPAIHLDGGQVWTCMLDVHTHLDKSYTSSRAENADGTFARALCAVEEDKVHWSADDLRARMDFGLRCSYAHGTSAVRTHLDSWGERSEISWQVFEALRDRWAGRICLQAASLTLPDMFLDGAGREHADRVARYGGVLGCATLMTPRLDDALERIFELAIERGLDLDFHADETDDPCANSLRRIAETALRHRFSGRIVCGHCCSLALQPRDVALTTLDRVAEAGVAVVALPMCNLYLQDRAPGRTPRWRGVTMLHEMRARGIPVAIASDNCRDPFHAFGDYDMLEVYAQAVRVLHLDKPHGDWPRTASETPADIMGLPGAGRIGAGLPADLILFHGRTFSELLSRREPDRMVLRAGRAIDTSLPDYRELDPLFAVEPCGKTVV